MKKSIMMLASNMAATLWAKNDQLSLFQLNAMISQCDDFEAFKKYALKELKRLSSRLNVISDACDRISQSIDGFEMYSYQFNIKVIGLPLLAAKETTEQTANLCLQLFHQMGVKDVSINDIDIAHRVPSRNPSNRPDSTATRIFFRD